MEINSYFSKLKKDVLSDYEVAGRARAVGIDPVSNIEVPLATSLAEKVTGLISSLYPQVADRKIVERILELEKEYGSLDPAVALKIAEEIAKEKFCKFKDHKEAIEGGARIAIAYLTLGVVSSPIEGFVSLEICKTRDGKDYFAPFYSGPIRSAGGTEAAFSVVIIDYLRELFGYDKYDPSEDEVRRGVHESYLYHERVTNLQYLPTEKEIEFLLRNVPVQVTGDPSEDIEVYNYKDLPRINSNFIRSGFCLTINEGIAQKAPKILKRIQKLKKGGFQLNGWDWLDEFVKFQNKIKENKAVGSSASAVYIKDLVAGRPVFGHPSRSGAFRLRYGRCRNTGYSALGMNPATMSICGDFIAVGTQLKIEKPTKGCTIASCTTIDGPIVKLKSGEVVEVSDSDEAKRIYKDVEEIIYLGDLLIPYGDYANRNHSLNEAGYVEQYWKEELKKAGGESELFPDFEKAVEISNKYKIPLHPKYIYYWNEIESDEFLSLLDWIARGAIKDRRLILPYSLSEKERFSRAKRAFELIGCAHKVGIEHVILNEANSRAVLFNLGISYDNFSEEEADKSIKEIKELLSEKKSVFDMVNCLSSIEIKDKSGTFIGARMGRPEKAKLRKLTGSPHVLFPVGNEGGRLRSFQAALGVGSVKAEFPIFYCENCKNEGAYPKCIECGNLCSRRYYCRECNLSFAGKCLEHEIGVMYKEKRIEISKYFEQARKQARLRNDEVKIIKGIRGTSNRDHSCENLAKGLLRAKHSLNVNKDGTIRYDITEQPITHFKPKEIGTSVEKLREMGYEKDIFGNFLENTEQILEIFPHDVILPACPYTQDERADDVLLRICSFVDDELEFLYGLERVFNVKRREELAGVLVGCISPHNCAAVVGRVIGFSRTQSFLASPYMHAAMRRDCDGDEAGVMLLMDMLLNFSRSFLPAHRGGTQDAPLVLNVHIKAGEVDDMIFDLDTSKDIPLELYLAAQNKKSPYDVKMEQVRGRLGGDKEFSELWYSYDSDDINFGPLCSSYKTLPTMNDKVNAQMELCKKIRAVDVNDVSRLIIERHFIRDTRGNLRKFSMQVFRCVDCNSKFRRPPLGGKCTKCGGKLIFTISEGSILKYMKPALELARTYNASPYLLESLELTEMYIQSIFGKEKEKQEALGKWF
ncbi:MAG: DNA polymerase II large subunit [Nanoarchaeota archaeon]